MHYLKGLVLGNLRVILSNLWCWLYV